MLNNLEDVLHVSKGTKVIKQTLSRLTAPGENYGSVMLKLNVTVATAGGSKDVYLVAKTLLFDEKVVQAWNKELSFRTEHHFYRRILPMLQNFQNSHGVPRVIDCFPKYYGSRLNLNGTDLEVDANAIILLENLTVGNYTTVERTQGFDFEVAKKIVVSLADLHATALAFRLYNPEVFATEVIPFLVPWSMNKAFHDQTKLKLQKVVSTIPELSPLRNRILTGFDKKLQTSQCRHPFATLIHNDCWTNNIMVTPQGDHKLLDFQLCAYGSLAKDLIFFLFLNVQTDVLRTHYSNLIGLYYDTFRTMLDQLECDVEFEFEDFEKELAFEAEHSQFGHLMFMLNVVLGPQAEGAQKSLVDVFLDEASDLYKQKLVFIVREFEKRNWI